MSLAPLAAFEIGLTPSAQQFGAGGDSGRGAVEAGHLDVSLPAARRGGELFVGDGVARGDFVGGGSSDAVAWFEAAAGFSFNGRGRTIRQVVVGQRGDERRVLVRFGQVGLVLRRVGDGFERSLSGWSVATATPALSCPRLSPIRRRWTFPSSRYRTQRRCCGRRGRGDCVFGVEIRDAQAPRRDESPPRTPDAVGARKRYAQMLLFPP